MPADQSRPTTENKVFVKAQKKEINGVPALKFPVDRGSYKCNIFLIEQASKRGRRLCVYLR